jgi:membrane-associated phospholipid phosphatase
LDIVPIIPHISNASFPSSHALFFGVSIIVLIRWFFPLYQKVILILLGWIMCLSRLIWAIHYPSDVLAWIIIWAFLGYYTYKIIFLVTSRFYTLNHS